MPAEGLRTGTVPSTVQLLPMFVPASQVAVEPTAPLPQRGQTWLALVENTIEERRIGVAVESSVPFRMSNVPRTVSAANWFITHTGVFAAKSGSGGPKVAPLSKPAPVGPQAVQTEFVVLSHRDRNILRPAPAITGKLCEWPGVPVSRSVPWSSVVKVTSVGPAVFLTQVPPGIVVVVVPPWAEHPRKKMFLSFVPSLAMAMSPIFL